MASTAPDLTDVEKKACMVLSELFLDSEPRLDLLATNLEGLHMPLSSLDKILRYDLFPILYPNCLSVAGEWAGFDESQLLHEVECQRTARPGFLKSSSHSIAWLAVGSLVTEPWEQIKERLRHKLPDWYCLSSLLFGF